jgi:hypothetical protein
MRESGRAALEPIRLVRAVRHEPHPELTLGGFDRGVRFALGHRIPFGEQLEVMDQGFHVPLHVGTARRAHLVVVERHGAGIGAQPVDALAHDAVGLPHLLDAHEVTVVAVAVDADRNVEVHVGIDLVGLLLAQIPLHARATQHGA